MNSVDVESKYRGLKAYWRTIVGLILSMGVLGFLFASLYQNWDEFHSLSPKISYSWLTGSFILFLGYFFLLSLGWHWILRDMGVVVPFRGAFQTYMLSQLGKYLPGKVWIIAGRIYLAEKWGVRKEASSVGLVLESILNLFSAFLLGLIGMSGVSQIRQFPQIWRILLLSLPTLLLLHPVLLRRLVNFGLKKLRREPMEISLAWLVILKLLGVYTAAWAIFGLAFYTVVSAVTPLGISKLPWLTAAMAFSWIIGYLSVFAPGGLGVREGVLVYLLTGALPASTAIVVALLSRICMTLAELVGVGFAWMLGRRKSR